MIDPNVEIFHVDVCDQLPVTAEEVAKETKADRILTKVLQFTLQEWKPDIEPDLQPYLRRSSELSVENGCLLWGTRVIIPMHNSSIQDIGRIARRTLGGK